MKLSIEQRKRLRLLHAKKADDLSEDEKNELLQLKSLAEEAKYDYGADDPDLEEGEDDEDGLSAKEVKALVAESMKEVLEGSGISGKALEDIKAKLEGADTIDAKTIKAAIEESLKGAKVDGEELTKAIKAALPEDAVSKTEMEKMLKKLKEEFAEEVQDRQKKMVHSARKAHAPIEHRQGNLTVAAKQLLNICMMHSDEISSEKKPKGMNDGITEDQLAEAKSNGEYQEKAMRDMAVYGAKTVGTGMWSDAPGFGAELINVDLSTEIQNRMYLDSELAARLIGSEVQMPSNPFKFPLSTSLPTFYRGEENVTPSDSRAGTGEIILDAKKMIAVTPFSYEADEDAIVPMLGFLQSRLATSGAQSLEEAFVNGDDTGVHMDSDVTSVADRRKVWKGLRFYGQSVAALKSDWSTGDISTGNIGALRKLLGKYGINPNELLLVFGVKGYNDVVQLGDTLTFEKVAGAARILTGIAPQIFGIPIIVSAAVREDLNASGVYDGVTETKGSAILVHTPSWIVGRRKAFTIEVDRDIKNQTNWIVAHFRRDFVPMEDPSATESIVGLAYNYAA